jgi:hypothetical protein
VLTVTKPDRLARSTAELLSIEADLSKRGIGLVLSMGGERLDTRNPTSKRGRFHTSFRTSAVACPTSSSIKAFTGSGNSQRTLGPAPAVSGVAPTICVKTSRM